MSIRITGGVLRGRNIPSPSGREVRPTSSLLRQAIFNILADRLPGAGFLDLYAGSGILSIEALSRGAARAVAVEKAPAQVATLRKTALELALPNLQVVAASVESWLRNANLKDFDILYADPPFTQPYPDLQPVLEQLPAGACALLEYPTRNPPPWMERAQQQRPYGESSLGIFYLNGA